MDVNSVKSFIITYGLTEDTAKNLGTEISQKFTEKLVILQGINEHCIEFNVSDKTKEEFINKVIEYSKVDYNEKPKNKRAAIIGN